MKFLPHFSHAYGVFAARCRSPFLGAAVLPAFRPVVADAGGTAVDDCALKLVGVACVCFNCEVTSAEVNPAPSGVPFALVVAAVGDSLVKLRITERPSLR